MGAGRLNEVWQGQTRLGGHETRGIRQRDLVSQALSTGHLEAWESLRSSKQGRQWQDLCLRKMCRPLGGKWPLGQAWNLRS